MLRRLARSIDRSDVLAVLGVAIITYGLAEYSPPLAYIIPGGVLIVLAAASARRR